MPAEAPPRASRPASLLRNFGANFGGYVASVLISFFLSPVIIHSLGDSRYGVWAIVGQLTGYYGLLELGIRGAVSHFVARHTATMAHEAVRRTVSSAFWVLCGIGGVALLAGAVLTTLLPRIFDLGTVEVGEARLVLLLMSFTVALSLPMAVFQSVLVGNRRFDLVNAIEIGARVASSLLIWIALRRGAGLVALGLIQCATSAVVWYLTIVAARRLTGDLSIRPSWVSREHVRALVGYGSQNAVINLSELVVWRLDLVVVGSLLGVKWVTFYSIGAALVNYAWSACTSISLSYTPHFTHLHASGEHGRLKTSYLTGARLVGALAMSLFANLAVYGADFLRLWLGSTYVSGEWGWRSDTVMRLLVLASTMRVLQSISWQLLFATQKQRFLMHVQIGEAALNLLLSVLLAPRLGPAGVAIGTLVPMALSNTLLIPRYMMRTFGLGWSEYVVGALGRSLLVGVIVFFAASEIRTLVEPSSWPAFFLSAAISAGVSAAAAMVVGLTAEERRAALARAGALLGRA